MASKLLPVVQQQLLASINRLARIQQHLGAIVVRRMRAFTILIATAPTPLSKDHRWCSCNAYA
jgi:hypothetical protein